MGVCQSTKYPPTSATIAAADTPTVEFYKRLLPAACVDFRSDAGAALLAEALSAGKAACFFGVVAQFRTQVLSL